MDPQQAQMMQNYPDPTAVAADLNGPFYAPNNGQQQQQQAQQPQQQQHMQQPPQQQQPNVQQEQHQDQRISNPEQQLAQHAVELSGMASQMAPQDYKPMMQNRADGTQSPQPAHQNMPFQHEQQMMGADMGHGSVDHSQEAFGTPGDGQAPRKRSKVSRACDECRRKKIRCDATSEGPNASCTSCKRMGAACQFSRVPMKRGPSKGYIKELADRLNQLEGAIQGSPSGEHVHYPQQNVDMSRRQSQDFSPPPGPLDTPSIGRKRGYSSVTQDFSTPGFPQQTTHRQSGQWSQMDMPRQTPNQFAHAAPEQYRPVFSPNGLAPQAQFPVGRDPRLTMDNSFSPDGMNLNDRLEIDDAVLDEYYRTIHSTLPVLPWKDALFERLSRCSAPVANALLLSLLAVVNSFNGNYNLIDTRKASSAVSLCMQDDFAQAKQFGDSRVVLLSAVTLMAIDAGLRSNNAGSQSSFLGQALAVAKDLGLYGFQYDGRLSPDSDEYLLRRIWISLAILDRCHSAAWSVPLLISESSFVLYAEDEETLGSELYYTARITDSLGQIASFTTSSKSSDPEYRGFFATLMNTRLNDLRIALPPTHTSETAPLTYLFHWHTRLLLSRLCPIPATEILQLARQVLETVPSILSPMSRDFTVLAVISVMEQLDSADSNIPEQADGLLQNFLNSAPRLMTPGSWDQSLRDLASKRGVNISSPSQTHTAPQAPMGGGAGGSAAAVTASQGLASQGLQHLADLATAENEGRESDLKAELTAAAGGGQGQGVSWDKEKLTKCGFLTILSDARATVLRT